MVSASEILAPGLLIAPPSLLDPNFVRSVVLLAIHNDDGALGFVINRASPLTVGELVSMAGYGEEVKRHGAPVLVGGPVQPSSVWILARDPVARGERADALPVGEHLYVTSSRPALDDFVRALDDGRPDPMRRLLLAGYSGWAAGQLEAEIAAGAWLPVPLDEDIVLDRELEAKWERAYALQGLTPASLINMRGGGEA